MKKTALIVDSEMLIRYSLLKALQGMGMEASAVPTGEEAVTEISERQYDLCLLDMILPGIPGLGVMQAIHENSPGTKVIVITGCYIDDKISEGLKTADYFITKPFDIYQVRRLANEALFGNGVTVAVKTTLKTRIASRNTASEAVYFKASYLNEGRIHWAMMEGMIVNKSDKGIGMVTRQPFEVGRVLKIGNGDRFRAGIVRWSCNSSDKDEFRIGVEFI